MTKPYILPDSRLRTSKGSFRMKGVNRIPVFCANCGRPWGTVPEGLTYAFILCQTCADTYGDVAGLYKEPDDVFRQRCQDFVDEQAHRNRLEADPLAFMKELAKQLEDPSSGMSKLAKDWQAHLRKVG